MIIRTLLIVVAMCAAAASVTVFAHPDGHGNFDEKPIPTNCIELANTDRYTNDVSYPEIKTLKARCDAREKKETESRKTPASQPRPKQ